MEIKSMVEREDFYRINEKTLEDYFFNVLGITTKIRTNYSPLFGKVFIYGHINAIMVRFPSAKIWNYIFAEFNVRKSLLKYTIAKLYVSLCFLSFGLMADKTLTCRGINPFSKDILIWPCNRKIRIFNFGLGYVDSIVKDSFTKKYFDKEVSFRLVNKYSFILPIETYGENWYREKILPGQSLARIKDSKLYNKCCDEAIIYLREIICDTLIYVDPKEYSEKLYHLILDRITTANRTKKINCSSSICEFAFSARKQAEFLCKMVPLAISHGDLRPGNLWVDTTIYKTYIIDWETNDIRSIWYDTAALLLEIRLPNGIINMFNNRESATIKEAVLKNDTVKEYNMSALMGILMLEDILFHLDDMLELPGDIGSDIFNRICGEIKSLKFND